ncbi:MAG TPA: LLM class F420-dependent oxidoreductase [Acidimicrobiales bacterium]|jgi:F420-dependent oxidoreductase-like protein
MQFGFWPNASQAWPDILDAAAHAERTGWDSVWIADHFLPFTDDTSGPVHECWALLAGLAVAVPRVRLGSLVVGNTYRHPAVLAKQAASVDHLSGGRLVLGLGAGWQENEHVAYGIEYSTVKGRLDRLEEACAVITSLLRQDRSTSEGTHYRLQDAPLAPKPVGSLPLLIGGGGEQRTLRIAATYADEWNTWGTPDLLAHKGAVLERHCADVGRDPATIRHSANALLFLSEDESWLAPRRDRDVGRPTIVGTPTEVVDIVAAYAQAGVDELIIPDFNLGPPSRRRDTMELFMNEVASRFTLV